MDAWVLRPKFKRMMAPPFLRVVILGVGADGDEAELEYLTLARASWAEASQRESVLEELVQGQIEQGRNRLILDLSTLEKLDSSGIAEIVIALEHATELGGELVLANLRPGIREIFRYTGLDSKMPIYDSMAEAVRHFDS